MTDFRGSEGSGGSVPSNIADNRAAPVPNRRHGDGCRTGSKGSATRLDFAAINAAARRELPALLARWLPDGRATGREWTARNPRRADRQAGSFRVNLRTGRWADFATGDRGGDPVSLAAFLFGLSQVAAARRLRDMLGVS